MKRSLAAVQTWSRDQETRSIASGKPSSMLLDFIEVEADRLGELAGRFLTPNAWPARRIEVRQQLLVSLGLDPLPPRTPLHDRVVGVTEGDGYRIERLIFEPRPGFRAPALLYRPSATQEPMPAVLYSEGHWMRLGKSHELIQSFCIGLAKLGCVVLVFDPIGQGERGASFEDHGHAELLPIGMSQEGLMVWEHMRAVDYLLTRTDVDGNRIGLTGASGGGLSTVYVAAVDDRIAAAVPVCYVTSFARFLRVMRGLNWNNMGDLCNQVPKVIAYAEMAGLCGLIWPRPLLFINGLQDPQFPVAGARDVLDRLRPLYDSIDPARVDLRVVDAGHGYDQAMREAAYGWFLRWLRHEGDGSPVTEPPHRIRPAGDSALHCFRRRPLPSGPAIKALATATATRRGLRSDGASVKPTTPTEIRRVLGMDLKTESAVVGQCVGSLVAGQLRAERHQISPEAGIIVPTLLIEPVTGGRGAILYLDDDGKMSDKLVPIFQRFCAAGTAVYALDPRGTGETLPVPPSQMTLATVHGTLETISSPPGEHLEFETATDCLMLGRSLLGQQVLDVLAAVDYLVSIRPESAAEIRLVARGPLSSLRGLFAAALDTRFRTVSLDGLLWSFSSLVYDPGTDAPFTMYVYDVLRYFDLADVAALLTAGEVDVRPVDRLNRPVAKPQFLHAYRQAIERLAATGCRLRVIDSARIS